MSEEPQKECKGFDRQILTERNSRYLQTMFSEDFKNPFPVKRHQARPLSNYIKKKFEMGEILRSDSLNQRKNRVINQSSCLMATRTMKLEQ